jgi:DNA-directed RNA polymerase specialized sigma24 family protein
MPERHPRTAPAATGSGRARPRDAQPDQPPQAGSRLDADRHLWEQLAAEQFSGRAYHLFEAELFSYSYPIVLGWIRNGRIIEEALRRGARGLRAPSAEWRAALAADAEDVAQETIIRALGRFRDEAVAGRGWTPGKGAALTTYFVGGCLFAFVEVYRVWSREAARQRLIGHAAESADQQRECAPADPADVVIAYETVEERLASGSPVQRALFLGAAGYTQAEIAEILGVTARAVEGWLRRHRRRSRRENHD